MAVCIRLHIKVLTNPINFSIETMLNRMREVYRTAGVGVEVVSREDLTPVTIGMANFNTLNSLDVGACQRGTPSNEQIQLFQHHHRIVPSRRPFEIVVYFVQDVQVTAGPNPGAKNGCASHPDGRPGAAIASIASQWTLAHEVGHVLRLGHVGAAEHQGCPAATPECCSTPATTRLMTGCSTSRITGTPTFSHDEQHTILRSHLIHSC
jgi:hypothetical protein